MTPVMKAGRAAATTMTEMTRTTRISSRETPGDDTGVIRDEKDNPVCLILSGEWGDDLDTVHRLLRYHETTVACCLVVCSSKLDAMARGAKLAHFDQLVVGPLDPPARGALEVSAGIGITLEDTGSCDRDCHLLIRDESGTSDMPFVFWN